MDKLITKARQIRDDLAEQFSAGGETRSRLLKRAGGVVLLLLILPKLWPLVTAQVAAWFVEPPEPERFEVDAVRVERQLLDDTIQSTGTVKARYEVELSTEVAGKITELHINEGQPVQRGDLLVKINDNDLQADLKRIKSNIEVMEESENRQRQLFERGGATQEDYDATRIQLNNLRAEMAAIEAQIERTEVRAPFDGVLGLKYVDEGSYITPSTRIATLRDLGTVYLDFSVPERYSSRIRTGSEVKFTVQGVDSLFTGRVFAVEPGIDPRARTVNIRAVTDNEEGLLRSGAFANLKLVLESYDDAIMIPAIALIPDDGQYKVMVYEDGQVRERLVETGIRTRNSVQVTSGLEIGETVLINGLLQVQEGMDVALRQIRNLN